MRAIPEVVEDIKNILNDAERTQDGECLVYIDELANEILVINSTITPCYLENPCEYQNEDINTDNKMSHSIIEKLWNYARKGEGTWDELVKEIGLSDDEFYLLMSIFT